MLLSGEDGREHKKAQGFALGKGSDGQAIFCLDINFQTNFKSKANLRLSCFQTILQQDQTLRMARTTPFNRH